MSSTEQLDRMLIEHLADLDDGVRRFEFLQLRIATAIDELIDEWLIGKEWRRDENTWKDDLALSVGRTDWRNEEKDWLAWFDFDYGAGDDGEWSEQKDYFWLTRLCGVGRGQMGFRFAQEEFGKTPWKRYLNENRDRLAVPSFIYEQERSFFLPVKVDKDLLAKGAEEEDFSEALQPIKEALDHIYEVSPRFEQMRQDMLAKQGS